MRCKNCALECMSTAEKRKLRRDMTFDEFRRIVNELIDYGFDEFQLTPTVGEPFLHPDFLDMIEYLENKDKVKRITFFTNLAVKDIGQDINWLMKNTIKTVMFVSVYGTNRSDFDEFTNTTKCYKNFTKNLSLLKAYYKSSFRSLNFFIRNPKYKTSTDRINNAYINTLAKIKTKGEFFARNNIQEHFWNGNWCGTREDVENKRINNKNGPCFFAFIDNIVDADGSIFLCGACDIKRICYIGNIFTDGLNDVYKEGGLYHEIIDNQGKCIYPECCRKCSEFHFCDSKTITEFTKLHKWNSN